MRDGGIRRLYGKSSAAAFGPVALKAVREHLLKPQMKKLPRRNERGRVIGEQSREHRLSRRTINSRIAIIKRVFSWGVENELVPALVDHALRTVNGLRKHRSVATEPRQVKPVADEHVDAVLSLVSSPVRAMIELQRLTGARSGELCAMREDNIDQAGGLGQTERLCLGRGRLPNL